MSIISREIVRTGDFVYRLHTELVAAMPGVVNVRITSGWTNARRPQDEQCQLSLTMNQEELKTLIVGLQASLSQA